MDALVLLILLSPLCAAILVGGGHLFGHLDGEESESITSSCILWAITLSCLLSLVLLVADMLGKNAGSFDLGRWLSSDTLTIRINFITTGFSVRLAALFSVLLAIVIHFSTHYMHREAGFHRFFFILSLFSFAMLLLVLSGNAVGTLIGWEIAGLCSYLLIAYSYQRPIAVSNATRVLVTNHIGDGCFILGIGLSFAWTETVNWNALNIALTELPPSQITGIALCFTLAAFAKSAQLPFTPWLARAMEGPTPSSAVFYGAVMIHAGIYLVCLLRPLIELSFFVMCLLVAVGFLTALYSFIVGLTQSDVKSSLVYAISAQLGLMFLECGLGFWQIAKWHLCAHAVVRAYQLLAAPNLMHAVHGNPIKPVSPKIASLHWLYTASLQRFWLDQITDWALVKPVRRLGHDLCYIDDQIVDRLMGMPNPALHSISSLAQLEEAKLGARLDNSADEFAQGSGFAGALTEWTAGLLHWFEEYFVLQGVGTGGVRYGRELGHFANKIEYLILKPRYLVLFVFITLLVAF
ncbi:MAG: proton-conducting transporter membrane subunit [Methylococcales bacterium]|nr:proton-conducting transporter membrane subunit [Methylococcales bacterium]